MFVGCSHTLQTCTPQHMPWTQDSISWRPPNSHSPLKEGIGASRPLSRQDQWPSPSLRPSSLRGWLHTLTYRHAVLDASSSSCHSPEGQTFLSLPRSTLHLSFLHFIRLSPGCSLDSSHAVDSRLHLLGTTQLTLSTGGYRSLSQLQSRAT
jgi:hypothetical protein